jgi:peptidoglycan/LPS O-acetylase OafA/YrhL
MQRPAADPTDERRRYVAALTGLRGVAAVMVFLFHYAWFHPGIRLDLAVPLIGPVLHTPFGFGFAGVDIFFVLSGFLLTLPFAGHALGTGPRPDLPRYFRRRLLRVFPAYYVQLFIMLLVGAWFVSWKPQTTPSLIAHLVMFFNIGWQPVSPMVGVWWTLPVELGFYLVLPFIATLMRPPRWVPALAVALVLSIAYRYFAAVTFGPDGQERVFLVASQLPGSLAEFLLGSSAALLAQKAALANRRRPPAWLLDTGFVAGLVLPGIWLWNVVLPVGERYWMGHWSMLLGPIALGLPLATAVYCLYRGSRLGSILLANRAVYFLGLVSYSLYLWHFVVMQQLIKAIGPGYAELPHWITFPLSAGSVLAVAGLSYYVVERPFYRLRSWRQALRGRQRPSD